jgi:hypothetical protein
VKRRNVKNVRIIKQLLERPNGSLTKYKLAKASGCSRQWVIQFLRKLEEMDLVHGTKVKDIMGLARYGAKVIPRPLKVLNLFHSNPVEFVTMNVSRYAFTTYSAENLITHHLFPSRYDVYLEMDMLEALYEKAFNEGWLGSGNLRLIVPVDARILDDVQKAGDVTVVGLGQLMIDLVKEGGVCEEAVQEMVRRNVWGH